MATYLIKYTVNPTADDVKYGRIMPSGEQQGEVDYSGSAAELTAELLVDFPNWTINSVEAV